MIRKELICVVLVLAGRADAQPLPASTNGTVSVGVAQEKDSVGITKLTTDPVTPFSFSTNAAASVGMAQGNDSSDIAKAINSAAPYAVAVVAYLIGRRQVKTARDQLRTEEAKLRLELFEKRMAVYKDVQNFFNSLPPMGHGAKPDRESMRNAIVMARFLFVPEVASCLEQALDDSWNLRGDDLLKAMKDDYLKSRDLFIREMNFEVWQKSRA